MKVPARRVSMMELTSFDRIRLEKTRDGSHSLPESWSGQRQRINSFACAPRVPSLSTALISSSSESSEDDIDEEEERAWPLTVVQESPSSSHMEVDRRRRPPLRRQPRRTLLNSLLRRPSAPVWRDFYPMDKIFILFGEGKSCEWPPNLADMSWASST